MRGGGGLRSAARPRVHAKPPPPSSRTGTDVLDGVHEEDERHGLGRRVVVVLLHTHHHRHHHHQPTHARITALAVALQPPYPISTRGARVLSPPSDVQAVWAGHGLHAAHAGSQARSLELTSDTSKLFSCWRHPARALRTGLACRVCVCVCVCVRARARACVANQVGLEQVGQAARVVDLPPKTCARTHTTHAGTQAHRAHNTATHVHPPTHPLPPTRTRTHTHTRTRTPSMLGSLPLSPPPGETAPHPFVI